MVGGIHHATLAVSDLPRAVSFYSSTLGLTLVGPDDSENTVETADYVWMDIGDGEWINFAYRPDATPNHPGEKDDPHLAFRATEEDIETVKRRLVEQDVEVHETRTSIYFHGPDGNFLELTYWNGPDK
jgi:catechol 2,3-dioxygenase-like lactoylglutathione lyase family enzyme